MIKIKKTLSKITLIANLQCVCYYFCTYPLLLCNVHHHYVPRGGDSYRCCSLCPDIIGRVCLVCRKGVCGVGSDKNSCFIVCHCLGP